MHRAPVRLMPPLILMYHSVQKVRTDPWGLRVSPRNFEVHIKFVRERLHPMRLDEMDRALKAGETLPQSAVAITFDDGYADNLLNAKPILQRYEVPATVFVATGTIGTDHEYWWDDLERMLLLPRHLPRVLRLEIDRQSHEWNLQSNASVSALNQWRWRNWRAWYPGVPSQRHAVFLEVWKALKRASSCARQQAMEQLREWAAAPVAGRETHRCLTNEELRELARGGLVEIGAHTVTHPSLASLSAAEQRDEIHQSKTWLQQQLGVAITSFSYPFGTAEDYNSDTISALQNAGIERCCTTIPATLTSQSNGYEYPRIGVMNWNEAEFIERVYTRRQIASTENLATIS